MKIKKNNVEFLNKCSKIFQKVHYNIVVIERATQNYCGYPLCNKLIDKKTSTSQINKKKYRIDVKNRKYIIQVILIYYIVMINVLLIVIIIYIIYQMNLLKHVLIL